MPISEQLFNEYRIHTEWESDVQQAVEFYYLVKCSFSGMMIGSGQERFSYSSSQPKLMSFYRTNWHKIWERFRGVQIFNRDAIDVIKLYDKPDHLIYLDPPYVVTKDKANYYKFQDSFLHQRLLNVLKELKHAKFLLSYDCIEEVKTMYDWANMIELDLKYILGNVKDQVNNERRERKEYLIANFEIGDTKSLERWF